MSISTAIKTTVIVSRSLQAGDPVWFGGYEGRVRAITARQGIQVEFLADAGAHRGRLLTRMLRADELQPFTGVPTVSRPGV